MDTLCRICIEHVAKCTSLSSKIEDSSNRSFCDFLNKCTTLNAREGDSLPQSLCSVCANAMKTFYSFMKLAEKSDIILREALRNLIAEGRYNGRREIPCGEVAITKKIEKGSKDFNQSGGSFHCQPSKKSTGTKLYMLDRVKKESRATESTSIVDLKRAEIIETEKLESDLDHPKGDIEELDDILFCIDRHITSNDTKQNDSEDEVPISLLRSRLAKNGDGADSRSNSLSEALCFPSNVQSKIGKTEAKSKEVVKEDPPRIHRAGGVIVIDNKGISCEQTTIRSEKVEEDSFHCQPRKTSTELSPYVLDFVKEEPRVSESTSIVAVKDAEIDESDTKSESSIEETDNVLSRRYRRRQSSAINYTELTDSDDDVPISFLDKRSAKNEDETYSESTTCDEEITITKKTENPHKCNQCGKEFTHKNALRRHMKWHANPKPFKCENCGKSLCRKKDLDRHIGICKRRSESKGSKYRRSECGICGKTYTRKENLVIHMELHMGIIPKCDICGKVFKPGNSLSKHMRMHNDPKRYNCEVCGKSLSSYYSKHREYCIRPGETVDIPKVECEICGKTYTRKKTLDIHMELHKGVTRKCNQCGKEFKHKLSYTRHMKWHENPRPFKCEYCGKSLARKPSYEKHKKLCKLADKEQQSNPQPIHTEPEKPILLPGMKVACKICDKQFRKRSYLNNHLETHKGIRYKCDQCGKDFKTMVYLRSHMERHTNPQSFKCEKCGECFAWKGSYNKHLEICKGPRKPKPNPKCEICGKQFLRKFYLGLHKETHRGTKKKCDECGEELSILSINKHMKRHANAKRFTCENCGKSFASKNEYMNSGHKEICKPVGNTIDDTVTNEEANLHSRGNSDIMVEITQ